MHRKIAERTVARIRRRMGAIRTLASLCTIAALLVVCAGVAFSTSMPHDRGMLSILGGILALAPYLLGRALEAVIDDVALNRGGSEVVR